MIARPARFFPRSPTAPGRSVVWALSGGINPANCIAVYQPIGAANLADSYVNIANPGTYNAAPGSQPAFDPNTGWTFNGTSNHLITGIIPRKTWTCLVRFSDRPEEAFLRFLVGVRQNTGSTRWGLVPYSATSTLEFRQGESYDAGPGVAGGVMALVGLYGYMNGVQVGGPFAGWDTPHTHAFLIGGQNTYGTPGAYFLGRIQAIAVYDTTLSEPQVVAVTNAMNALP